MLNMLKQWCKEMSKPFTYSHSVFRLQITCTE